MTIKLYGSTTSPFARRIRLALLEQNTPFELMPVNVFDDTASDEYQQLNPALRVPCADVDGEIIWDSFLILQKVLAQPLSFAQQKQLFLVNEANDAGVYLFQCMAFEVDPQHAKKPASQAKKRFAGVLSHMNANAAYQQWDTVGQAVFCFLDWSLFRGILDLESYPNLQAFYQAQLKREVVQQTDPRL